MNFNQADAYNFFVHTYLQFRAISKFINPCQKNAQVHAAMPNGMYLFKLSLKVIACIDNALFE